MEMEVTEAEALAGVEEPMTTKAVPVVATPVVQPVINRRVGMKTVVAAVGPSPTGIWHLLVRTFLYIYLWG